MPEGDKKWTENSLCKRGHLQGNLPDGWELTRRVWSQREFCTVKASTQSPTEEYLLEKAEGGMQKIGLISSERSREEVVGKGTFPWFMIKNDTSFDLQYIDQDYMQAPQSLTQQK